MLKTLKTTAGLGLAFCLSIVITQALTRFVPLMLQGFGGGASSGPALGPGPAMSAMILDGLVQFFLQPVAGRLSDRTKRRSGSRLIWVIAGAVVAGVGLVLVGMARGLMQTLLALLVTSLGIAALRAPAVALVADYFKVGDRDTANSQSRLIGVSLNMALIAIAAITYETWGATAAMTLLGVFVFITPIGLLLLLPSQNSVANKPAPVANQQPETLGGYLILMFFVSVAYAAFNVAITSYGVRVTQLSEAEATGLSTAAGLAFVGGTAVAGKWAKRFGSAAVLGAGLGAWALLFLTANWVGSAGFGYVAINLFFGFAFALVNVSLTTTVLDKSGDSVGVQLGKLFRYGLAGTALGPLLVGWTVEAAGGDYQYMFPLCAVLAVASIAAFASTAQQDRLRKGIRVLWHRR